MANLVSNYSPFLAPTTRSAQLTAELRRVLGVAAYDVLEEFLRKWRRVRSDSSTPVVHAVLYFLTLFTYLLSEWSADDCVRSQTVNTVLAKLFARGEKTTDFDALLEESEIVIIPEVEPVFRATGLYSALCKVYSKRGHDAELLEVWSMYAHFPQVLTPWRRPRSRTIFKLSVGEPLERPRNCSTSSRRTNRTRRRASPQRR